MKWAIAALVFGILSFCMHRYGERVLIFPQRLFLKMFNLPDDWQSASRRSTLTAAARTWKYAFALMSIIALATLISFLVYP